jgi:hypothetical protein
MTDTDDLRAKAQRVIDRDGDVYCPEGDALARYVLARLEEPRGAGVTHEQALHVLQGMVGTMDCSDMTLARYIREQAEIERRARALCKAIATWQRKGRAGILEGDIDATCKQLADALGEERE